MLLPITSGHLFICPQYNLLFDKTTVHLPAKPLYLYDTCSQNNFTFARKENTTHFTYLLPHKQHILYFRIK